LIKPLFLNHKITITLKIFLLATLLTVTLSNITNAQTAPVSTEPAAKTMTKAEKEAAKAKKEADLVEAFSKAGLTADEQIKCRAVLDASNEQTKPIKADAALSSEEKKAKLDVIYKERNNSLKVIMGDAKFKIFKATQKVQKEASKAKAE
jgi:hypothetical protein